MEAKLELIKDEPQHIKQGLSKKFLENLNIEYKILSKNCNYKRIIKQLKDKSIKDNKIVALLVRKNSFENNNNIIPQNKNFNRRSFEKIFKIMPNKSTVISTTGILSRELNEINSITNKINNFMCGGMGHAISIASGIAKKLKEGFCFCGDGSMAMHLGALSESAKNKNIIHVVFNNGSHGRWWSKTSLKGLKLFKIAKELGYKRSIRCSNSLDIMLKIALKYKIVVCRDNDKDGHRRIFLDLKEI